MNVCAAINLASLFQLPPIRNKKGAVFISRYRGSRRALYFNYLTPELLSRAHVQGFRIDVTTGFLAEIKRSNLIKTYRRTTCSTSFDKRGLPKPLFHFVCVALPLNSIITRRLYWNSHPKIKPFSLLLCSSILQGAQKQFSFPEQ